MTKNEEQHWSDCAMHSEPAYPAGECDCGGFNPIAWLVEDDDGNHLYWTYKEPIGNEKWTPLFSTPQPAQKPLSEAAIEGLAKFVAVDDFNYDFARAIEKAHGIKENT